MYFTRRVFTFLEFVPLISLSIQTSKRELILHLDCIAMSNFLEASLPAEKIWIRQILEVTLRLKTQIVGDLICTKTFFGVILAGIINRLQVRRCDLGSVTSRGLIWIHIWRVCWLNLRVQIRLDVVFVWTFISFWVQALRYGPLKVDFGLIFVLSVVYRKSGTSLVWSILHAALIVWVKVHNFVLFWHNVRFLDKFLLIFKLSKLESLRLRNLLRSFLRV